METHLIIGQTSIPYRSLLSVLTGSLSQGSCIHFVPILISSISVCLNTLYCWKIIVFQQVHTGPPQNKHEDILFFFKSQINVTLQFVSSKIHHCQPYN